METTSNNIAHSPVPQSQISNFLQIIENEQGEKINLDEVIVFAPFTEYGSVEDQVINLNIDMNKDTLKRIDQQKLIMLVKDRETIWNFELPKHERSRIRHNYVWLEIKRAFNSKYSEQ
jgi:hypothetical protein